MTDGTVLYAPHGNPSWAWCECGWTSRLCRHPNARTLLEAHHRHDHRTAST